MATFIRIIDERMARRIRRGGIRATEFADQQDAAAPRRGLFCAPVVANTRQASGPSTFQQTCAGYRVEADDRRAVLAADCKRRDQTIAHTKLEIEDVENIFGELRYK